MGAVTNFLTERLLGPPVPPLAKIERVIGVRDTDLFLDSGRNTADVIRNALTRQGTALRHLSPVLDFGCGVGRVLRHFRHDGAELYGTDYNPDLIAWCRSNLRFARFEENSLEGPLPYADQSFRFAYAFSVFTHLTEAQAIYWTQELARVLSPGGLLFFSVQGEEYLKHYWWPYRRHLEGSGQHEILHDLVEKYGIEHLERHTPLNEAETERFQRGDVVVLAEEVAGTNS